MGVVFFMGSNYEQFFARGLKPRLSSFVVGNFNYRTLSRDKRLLSAIAASVAAQKFKHLKGFIKWSLAEGIGTDAIYEILLQGHLFCGYPAAIESLFVFRDIIAIDKKKRPAGRKVSEYRWDVDLFQDRGQKTASIVYGKNLDLVLNNIKNLSPELAAGMIYEGYGRIISRRGLDLVTRELAIVAQLTIAGMSRQLFSHLRGAANAGASKKQIEAVICQSRLFASAAKITKALIVLEKSLGSDAFQR